jgi:hypothetical protein
MLTERTEVTLTSKELAKNMLKILATEDGIMRKGGNGRIIICYRNRRVNQVREDSMFICEEGEGNNETDH